MQPSRRALLQTGICLAATLGITPARAKPAGSPTPAFRIATEEAFSTREIFGGYLELLTQSPEAEPGFAHFWETALGKPGSLVADLSNVIGGEAAAGLVAYISKAAAGVGSEASITSLARLFDIDDTRLHMMDEAGVAMQIVSLASPGVQVFEVNVALQHARHANDQLAAAIARHPKRLAGLAAVAPQDVESSVNELDRAIKELGLRGAIINSHTKGEYLDEEKYRPLLAKLDELRAPLYLHPRTPSPQMLAPFTKYPGLAAATYGFNVETALHALRLILSGVFDDFPNLTVILGHMGEGLPFWIDRVDNRTAFIQTGPGPKPRKLREQPSHYLRHNFFVTTSGMTSEPALRLAHEVMGADRIMFAADYPMEEMNAAVRALDQAQLSDLDKAKIYRSNAERLFKLS